jgi:meiotically up-regulated gene 157 (Mug157) protein
MYAYEVDGYGNYVLMDDANVPSLLSIPYLGYRPVDDPIYCNTRAFLLSEENPYYYEGKYARGMGSPHTPEGYIWHIGLIMQAMTSTDRAEQGQLLEMLLATTAGTHYMHESFDPDDPAQYTRTWFAWANSLFSQWVIEWVDGGAA